MNKKIRNYLINISLLLLSFITSAFFGEIMIRVFVQNLRTEPHLKNIYASNKFVGYTNSPGFSANSNGVDINISEQLFRGIDKYGENNSSTFRILVLGDSQTFGLKIPENKTFVKILERKLNIDSSSKYEVINAGVSGYNTVNMWHFFEHYGLVVEPDLVLLAGFFNDYSFNHLGIEAFIIKDGYMTSTKKEIIKYGLPYPIKKFLRENSHLYYYFMWKFAIYTANKSLLWLDVHKLDEPDYLKTNWKTTFDYLDKIINSSAKNNIPFVYFNIPHETQIDDDIWQNIVEANPGNYNRNLIEDKLSKYFEENSGNFLKLFDLVKKKYKELDSTENSYVPDDGHLDLLGNEIIGELIYDYLKINGLLTKKNDK